MVVEVPGNSVEHKSVLLEQALDLLRVRSGGVYVDCTLGAGGHAEGILERLQGTGTLIGLDRDPEALAAAGPRLRKRFSNLQLFHENFKNLPLVAENLQLTGIEGCLADLGVSSFQLDTGERGFSFRVEGRLDMRMDRRGAITAAHLVNQMPEDQLARIFRDYGEERQSRRIASAIVRSREKSEIRTTTQLAEIVVQAKGRSKSRIHPATQVFQALRIEVNQELEGLDGFLREAIRLLNPGGRIVVIAFHSLEDRIVKRQLRIAAGRCVCFRPGDLCTCPKRREIDILTARPLVPGPVELARNPRARSARLRAAEKLREAESRQVDNRKPEGGQNHG